MPSSAFSPLSLDVQRIMPSEDVRDVQGRMRVSQHQNIYEADFEYGLQPLRWESFTAGAGTITALPGQGGVQMRVTTASGDITIRQSRPYHRYQPGKSMMMSTAVNFGTAQANQRQRVGMFDDSNGIFIEQSDPNAAAGNPFGMFLVVRSDTTGVVVDTRVALPDWNGNRALANALDWSRIQMIWMEYAWYGAGLVRWGVLIEGVAYVLHDIGFGNLPSQVRPWARTGNLPARYEQRNVGTVAAQNDMIHYGVSVLVDGGIDDQRGFTYAYGSPWSATSANAGRRAVAGSANRIPVVSIRNRTMGTQEYTQASAAISGTQSTTQLQVAGTPWTVNQWQGRCVNYGTPAAGMLPNVARITSNTNNTLTIADVVTGGAAVLPVNGQNYTIGLINRGQILPRRLQITSDQPVFVELVSSTPTSPPNLTGANFTRNTASDFSFGLIDSSATAYTTPSGEVVYSIFVPANNPVDQPIENLFPLLNTIRGNSTDILTALVTNTSASTANVSIQIIGQEAMS